MQVEPHLRGDPPGEEGESARDQSRQRATRPHGGDQFGGAGSQADTLPCLVEGVDGQPLQHAHAFAEGFLEVDLPVHCAGGDGGDLFPDAGDIGELVEGFAGDDGAVHVGDQQAFAASTRPDEDGVHRGAVQGSADEVHVGGGGQGYVRGLPR